MHGKRLLQARRPAARPAPYQDLIPSLATGNEELAPFFMRIDQEPQILKPDLPDMGG
tara:strand:+ start:308 stop:478 length:171 start_codon:yes stop_codon:yes gene_type:complete